jgi:TfoX/Sxy family transcriptional regulator of competence genes
MSGVHQRVAVPVRRLFDWERCAYCPTATRSYGSHARIVTFAGYLRADAEIWPIFEALGASSFRCAGRSGPVTVSSYYEAPDPVVEDEDELRRWVAHPSVGACPATAKAQAREEAASAARSYKMIQDSGPGNDRSGPS